MRGRFAGVCGALLLTTALTALVTWPQVRFLSTSLANHHDTAFSIWRLAWIAHALATAPFRVFDANIFHPAKDTLAFSDATMLEGLLGTPLLWTGWPPALVYNGLLLAGYIGSGLGMFVLARHVTRSNGPALVAAAIFTVLPYRTEHVMHLELQWAMFIPLTFWAFHRSVQTPSNWWGALAGLCLSLQMLACVYYGVFLSLALVAFVPALLFLGPRQPLPSLVPVFLTTALVCIVLIVPFAIPYARAAAELGPRDVEEVTRYSARWSSYMAASSSNVLWGWTADRFGSTELRLFPGLTTLVLAAAALIVRPGRAVFLYGLTLALALELSFGLHGMLYRLLFSQVEAVQGFRATARFAVVASCALAVLAAVGTAHLLERMRGERGRAIVLGAILIAVAFEGANRPMALMAAEPVAPPAAYQMIRSAAPGTVLELPLPDLDRLPGWEPQYQLWSIWHWKPLVNGYSGYYPADYRLTVLRMEVFPESGTLDRLRAHGVRYIVVHRAFYDRDAHARLMLRMASRPELKPWGAYQDPVGMADLFELIPVD
ncbi:MAG: hypothetical protein AB7H96_08665 [Vicinamibacterales bacterium]